MNADLILLVLTTIALVFVAYVALWLERRALAKWLLEQLAVFVAAKRSPDFVVGDPADPYLLRWWVLPRNPVFNVYLHCFLRSDDDRALHDHPWHSLSLLLEGEAVEHTIAPGGVNQRRWLCAGDWRYRSARFAHRIELPSRYDFSDPRAPARQPEPCWTLFMTGPVLREWGFHCPEAGWIHWKRFTAPENKGAVGRGCNT